VKPKSLLATFLAVIAVLLTSCGTSDKIGSVTISAAGTTGTVNLAGLGGTLQLQVTANYTSGKIVDETNFSTFAITPEGFDENTGAALPAPPQTLTINNTGLVTAVDPAVCTWFSTTGNPSTPGWAYVGDYKIVASYRGIQSQPIYIPVASAASNQTGMQGECGPSSSGS
jgi:hypothetical protein